MLETNTQTIACKFNSLLNRIQFIFVVCASSSRLVKQAFRKFDFLFYCLNVFHIKYAMRRVMLKRSPSLSKHESQSFNPIFKRFSNPTMHVVLCRLSYINQLLSISMRDKNFEDYNLISRTTKKFSALNPPKYPSAFSLLQTNPNQAAPIFYKIKFIYWSF